MTAAAQGAAARAAAARAVDQVLQHGRTLDQALAAAKGLPERERAQAQALAYGALRWHCRHRALLGRLLARPLRPRDRLLEALLSVGLYQLLESGQPDYAAVSATVAASRLLGLGRASGLVNGVLRRFGREREALLAALADDEPAHYAHPRWLIEALRQDWPSHWQAMLAANQQPPPLWLRVRGDVPDYLASLRSAGLEAEASAAFTDGVKLRRGVPVAKLPGFAEGRVSVQDAAAQLAARLLAAGPGMRVLDACAAPGGKTGHLLEQAQGDLDLLALDVDAERLGRLRENLARLGLRARVAQGDVLRPADWWDGRPFQRILLDAPCSGTGVLRRHPDIRFLRRPADLGPLAERQGLMLQHLWPLLAPGGALLYATCSVLRAENQDVVRQFLAATPDARLATAWPLAGPLPVLMDGGWQLLPGPADTDGFYYALMLKQDP